MTLPKQTRLNRRYYLGFETMNYWLYREHLTRLYVMVKTQYKNGSYKIVKAWKIEEKRDSILKYPYRFTGKDLKKVLKMLEGDK